MALTEKQEIFCREYFIDLNATQAAIRVRYSEKTARASGCENLTKPDIQDRISELKTDRNGRLQIDATSRIQHKGCLNVHCKQAWDMIDRKTIEMALDKMLTVS